MMFILFTAIFYHKFLVLLLDILRRIVNFLTYRVSQKIHFDEEWAKRNVSLAHECFVDIKNDPPFYLKIIFWSVVSHVLNIITIAVVGWSFSERLTLY